MKRYLLYLLLLLPLVGRAACPDGTYVFTNVELNVNFVSVTNVYCVPNGLTFDEWKASLKPASTAFVPLASDDLWLQIEWAVLVPGFKDITFSFHGLVAGESYQLQISHDSKLGNWVSLGSPFVAAEDSVTNELRMYGPSSYDSCAFFRLKGPQRPNKKLVEFSCGLFLAMALKKGILS